MIRTTLASVGLVAVVLAIGIYQFGFFNARVSEVTQQIRRETAVGRAERTLRDLRRQADALSDQVRQLRIEARTKEIASERDSQDIEKTRSAMLALASSAQRAGLPKRSEATADHLKQVTNFAGRALTGNDVYVTLERWQNEAKLAEQRLETAQEMTKRLREAATQLDENKDKLTTSITKLRAKLDSLRLQKEVAKSHEQLSALEANIHDVHVGDMGTLLETIQDHIDELEARTDVYTAESTRRGPITPDEALTQGSPEVTQALDALWDKASDESSSGLD